MIVYISEQSRVLRLSSALHSFFFFFWISDGVLALPPPPVATQLPLDRLLGASSLIHLFVPSRVDPLHSLSWLVPVHVMTCAHKVMCETKFCL